MVAGDGQDHRIQNALVSKWPEPLDMEHDIFVPGKVERWSRELVSALRTRGLWRSISMQEPTLEQMADILPDEDVDAVAMSLLNGAHGTLFPRVVKMLKKKGIDVDAQSPNGEQ